MTESAAARLTPTVLQNQNKVTVAACFVKHTRHVKKALAFPNQERTLRIQSVPPALPALFQMKNPQLPPANRTASVSQCLLQEATQVTQSAVTPR